MTNKPSNNQLTDQPTNMRGHREVTLPIPRDNKIICDKEQTYFSLDCQNF